MNFEQEARDMIKHVSNPHDMRPNYVIMAEFLEGLAARVESDTVERLKQQLKKCDIYVENNDQWLEGFDVYE